MKIYYGGGETATLRRRLIDAEITRFSASFWSMRQRLPKSREFDFAEKFPEGSRIFFDSGGYSANVRREQHDVEFWSDYLDEFVKIIGENVDYLTHVTEFDLLDFSLEDLWAWRRDVWGKLPEGMFVPVWHSEHGFDDLITLSETYPLIAINGSDLEKVANRLPAISNRYGVRFHGLAVNPELAAKTPVLASMSSSAWTLPQRTGQLVVWYANKIKTTSDAESLVKQHGAMLEREGFDPSLIAKKDPDEVSQLTIWSYEQWAFWMSREIGPTPSSGEQKSTSVEPRQTQVAPRLSTAEIGDNAAFEGKKLLPVIGMRAIPRQDADGNTVQGAPEMHTRRPSARKCDTCYIRAACPEFQAGADCAFDIPVEIKTREQLVAMLTGMLEIQTQRALFARFAEELEGGFPTEKTSFELDRLMKMTKSVKEIQDDREFLEIHVKGRAQAGVLSRLFGEEAGQKARGLPAPVDETRTNELLAEVMDVETE